MTLEELTQKLALEKLVETGVGLVSEKTYDEIVRLFTPAQGIKDIEVMGIRLIKNLFIPDGQIYPFEKWKLRNERFPLKVKDL